MSKNSPTDNSFNSSQSAQRSLITIVGLNRIIPALFTKYHCKNYVNVNF